MLSEEEARNEAVRIELAKIAKANPNAIPLYIIVNTASQKQAIQQPLTLCSKDTIVKNFLVNIHQKYQKFENVYFFGKDHQGSKVADEEVQPKSKKKKKERATFVEQPEKLWPIDEGMLVMTVEQIHSRFKDSHGLLVVIVSDTPLIPKKRKTLYQPILLALTVLFAAVFLYLSFSEQQPAKSGSEIDYIV